MDSKYQRFIYWAKACGHWQVVQISENFELFEQNVPPTAKDFFLQTGKSKLVKEQGDAS